MERKEKTEAKLYRKKRKRKRMNEWKRKRQREIEKEGDTFDRGVLQVIPN